jgi:predicted amidohydrolase
LEGGVGLRVALVQMCCAKGDVGRNLAAIGEQIREARERGAEIVCFPEMSITGYIDPARWPEAVVSLAGPEVAEFAAQTAGTGVTALAGLVERNPNGKPFITQVVAQAGRLAGWYRKRTVVDEEAEWFSPGDGDLPVFQHGALAFGLAICADLDAPHIFAESARQGARVVFEAAAPGLYGAQETRDWRSGYDWWRGECESKLGDYARDNGIYIAVATQAGRTIDEDFPGGGFLFGPDGALLADTPDWSPGVLYATLTI